MLKSLMILLVLASACPAWAARKAIPGGEDGSWDTGELSIIVATVEHLDLDRPAARYRVTLVPKATIAGLFDPSLHPKLEASLVADPVVISGGGMRGFVGIVPHEGDLVMVVLHRPYSGEPVYSIPGRDCAFMRDESGVAKITGLDDAKVEQTLKRMREGRAKHKHPDELRQTAAE